LNSLLKEGSPGPTENPEIRFSKTQVDVLNNPKQISVRKIPKWFWDPQLADTFSKLASFFILVKNQDPTALAFMAKLGARTSLRKSPEPKEKAQEKKPESKKKESGFYFRRQRKRRSQSKYHSIKSD
jgi:hypothetical protein